MDEPSKAAEAPEPAPTLAEAFEGFVSQRLVNYPPQHLRDVIEEFFHLGAHYMQGRILYAARRNGIVGIMAEMEAKDDELDAYIAVMESQMNRQQAERN